MLLGEEEGRGGDEEEREDAREGGGGRGIPCEAYALNLVGEEE